MSLHGSWLTHPIQFDQRGSLQTTADRLQMVAQSIASIVETRQGERVMVPDYGIPDFVFEVMDAGFSARLAYFLERQIRRYEPLVDRVSIRVGTLKGDKFAPGFTADEQLAAIEIEFTVRGSNTPRNLVYPTWELR
jgi:phage baseplate assembly protein W